MTRLSTSTVRSPQMCRSEENGSTWGWREMKTKLAKISLLKALVGVFNEEKALIVGAFSVIVNSS